MRVPGGRQIVVVRGTVVNMWKTIEKHIEKQICRYG